MPQFFISPENIQGQTFVLKGPEAFHVAKVLRKRPGESLELFDGSGRRFEGTISEIGKDGTIRGALTQEIASAPKAALRPRVFLYQAALKPAHWDWMLEKGSELGVAAFIPLLTQRTVIPERAISAKEDRSRRVILAAAKQCGRPDLPELRPPVHLRDALASARQTGGARLFAWEALRGARAADALRPALREIGSGEARVHLFIGPEGGWADEEVELAEAEGARLFGLGPVILRAETAAVAAVAVINYELSALAE